MMKAIYTISTCLLSIYCLQAQIFFTESFEATGNYATGNAGDCGCVTADFDAIDGQNDHFADVVDLDITHNSVDDYMGERDASGNVAEGTARYWAAEDIDDPQVGGSGNARACLTLEIDIAGRNDLQFSGFFGGHNKTSPTPYEAENDMEVAWSIDGSSFTKILDWHENADETNISLDTDGDGIGDGMFPLGAVFQQVTAPIAGTGNTLIIQICMNSNSSTEEFAVDYIQIEESVVVPVELLSFEAKSVKNDVQLTWITASEIDNYGFEIEHSSDGKTWTTIDFVKGNGNSLSTIKYQYLDQEVSQNLNYYRLKQIDFDGDFEYSNIVNASIAAATDFRIYPNPVRDRLHVEAAQETPIRLVITDQLGRVVLERELDQSNNFGVESLAKGIYILSLEGKKSKHISRFIKL